MASAAPSALETWQRLLDDDHAALRDAAADADPGDVAAVARLRRAHDAGLVRAALDLAEARRKARSKMPGLAATLVADPAGVEMASSTAAAALKAAILTAPGRPVLDLCCGIGGDAVELARCVHTTAIDVDPLRAWMASRNAGCAALAADATALDVPNGAAVHMDPLRRSADGRRRIRLEDMTPGPAALRALLAKAASACVKLAPGVEPTELMPGQAHWVSESGRLTQGLLWRGVDHADGAPRLATTIGPGREPVTLAGEPREPPVTERADVFIHTMDPALERARLGHVVASRHGLAALGHPGAGLLTGEAPVDDAWLRPFRVLDRLPWQPRRVRARLDDLDAGIVTVKTRGSVVDAEAAQRDLRGKGTRSLVVFVQRLGHGVEALIADRAEFERKDASSVHADGR